MSATSRSPLKSSFTAAALPPGLWPTRMRLSPLGSESAALLGWRAIPLIDTRCPLNPYQAKQNLDEKIDPGAYVLRTGRLLQAQ